MTLSELRYIQTSADNLMDKYLSAIGTQTKQEGLALALLSISLLGLITTAMNNGPDALAQTTSSTGTEKKDIFKVIMTVQGLNNNTGDVVTIVSVNGESRVKLFDDSMTYINSINAAGKGGIVEYVATFPNMTVKNGDVYKVCTLIIKDSNLICETGTNSPALRPEFKDLYVHEEEAAVTSQAAMAPNEDE
jgi:hypothetical protein